MKKLLLVIAAVFTLSMTANSQNFLGVRGAFGTNNGAELSFQYGLGGNRLEFDLGWAGHEHWAYYNLSGVYQWTGTISGDFGWYLGVGANLGLWTAKDNNGSLGLGVLAQAGVEYNFQAVPLQVTLDVRPQWDVLGEASGFGYGLALGLRYRF